jgi:succinate dehydrogenase / fumarate reductase flavoprotein subunit
MSEAARGVGGRVWVPRDPADRRAPGAIPEARRFYFLEEFFPTYGNTVARDEASRAIWRVTREMGLGVGGGDRVYLDLTHLDRALVSTRLGAILEIYRKFAGADPLEAPMEIFPSAHYAMGGLWVDYERDPATGGMRPGSPRNHATNIPGLFACGECDYAYHGANRLGANSLLSASYSGRVTGESVATWLKGLAKRPEPDPALAESELRRQGEINRALMGCDGGESPYGLHRELGELMTDRVGVVRDNAGLQSALDGLDGLLARCDRLSLGESSAWANQTLVFARGLRDMIVLAQAVALSALGRDECRGAHYKPAFELKAPQGRAPGDPELRAYRERWAANNARWLKTTVAERGPDGPRISYREVDTSVLAPTEPRDYR